LPAKSATSCYLYLYRDQVALNGKRAWNVAVRLSEKMRRLSFFLAQRPASASFSLVRRCHLIWRNAEAFRRCD
jgi:hypothetical protein